MGTLYGTSVDTRSATFAPLTDDTQILMQWIALVLDTQVGAYWSDPTLGKSLRGYILRGMTQDQFSAIPLEVAAALEEDDRIASADVTATQTFTGGGGAAIQLTIIVTPKAATAGPFVFTAIASADIVTIALQGSAGNGT